MILRLSTSLLLIYFICLLPSCLNQSLDEESRIPYEGSGDLINPDDEDSVIEVRKNTTLTKVATTTPATPFLKTRKTTSKPTTTTTRILVRTTAAIWPKHGKEDIEPTTVTLDGKSNVYTQSILRKTEPPLYAVTPRAPAHHPSAMSRSTWILIMTAAIISCILIAVAIFIFKKRRESTRGGGNRIEYQQGKPVR